MCANHPHEEALVGVGLPVRWLCLACYQDWLRDRRAVIDAVLKGVGR